eukprot:TRINITY_DN112945_c0_g1_i1.p1 TRINITY_DN112945_c0_g1~~TRINITY_DN112945_c0_g1_i1.p1  ORF type:complete len:1221 (-),score=193.75 TRINITY_DN112945_c0_g1_i1:90-3752(-)
MGASASSEDLSNPAREHIHSIRQRRASGVSAHGYSDKARSSSLPPARRSQQQSSRFLQSTSTRPSMVDPAAFGTQQPVYRSPHTTFLNPVATQPHLVPQSVLGSSTSGFAPLDGFAVMPQDAFPATPVSTMPPSPVFDSRHLLGVSETIGSVAPTQSAAVEEVMSCSLERLPPALLAQGREFAAKNAGYTTASPLPCWSPGVGGLAPPRPLEVGALTLGMAPLAATGSPWSCTFGDVSREEPLSTGGMLPERPVDYYYSGGSPQSPVVSSMMPEMLQVASLEVPTMSLSRNRVPWSSTKAQSPMPHSAHRGFGAGHSYLDSSCSGLVPGPDVMHVAQPGELETLSFRVSRLLKRCKAVLAEQSQLPAASAVGPALSKSHATGSSSDVQASVHLAESLLSAETNYRNMAGQWRQVQLELEQARDLVVGSVVGSPGDVNFSSELSGNCSNNAMVLASPHASMNMGVPFSGSCAADAMQPHTAADAWNHAWQSPDVHLHAFNRRTGSEPPVGRAHPSPPAHAVDLGVAGGTVSIMEHQLQQLAQLEQMLGLSDYDHGHGSRLEGRDRVRHHRSPPRHHHRRSHREDRGHSQGRGHSRHYRKSPSPTRQMQSAFLPRGVDVSQEGHHLPVPEPKLPWHLLEMRPELRSPFTAESLRRAMPPAERPEAELAASLATTEEFQESPLVPLVAHQPQHAVQENAEVGAPKAVEVTQLGGAEEAAEAQQQVGDGSTTVEGAGDVAAGSLAPGSVVAAILAAAARPNHSGPGGETAAILAAAEAGGAPAAHVAKSVAADDPHGAGDRQDGRPEVHHQAEAKEAKEHGKREAETKAAQALSAGALLDHGPVEQRCAALEARMAKMREEREKRRLHGTLTSSTSTTSAPTSSQILASWCQSSSRSPGSISPMPSHRSSTYTGKDHHVHHHHHGHHHRSSSQHRHLHGDRHAARHGGGHTSHPHTDAFSPVPRHSAIESRHVHHHADHPVSSQHHHHHRLGHHEAATQGGHASHSHRDALSPAPRHGVAEDPHVVPHSHHRVGPSAAAAARHDVHVQASRSHREALSPLPRHRSAAHAAREQQLQHHSDGQRSSSRHHHRHHHHEDHHAARRGLQDHSSNSHTDAPLGPEHHYHSGQHRLQHHGPAHHALHHQHHQEGLERGAVHPGHHSSSVPSHDPPMRLHSRGHVHHSGQQPHRHAAHLAGHDGMERHSSRQQHRESHPAGAPLAPWEET